MRLTRQMANAGEDPRMTPIASGRHKRVLPTATSGRLPIIVLLIVVVALLFVWRYHRATSPVSGGRFSTTQPAR